MKKYKPAFKPSAKAKAIIHADMAEQEQRLLSILMNENAVKKFFRGLWYWFLNKKRVVGKWYRETKAKWFPSKKQTYVTATGTTDVNKFIAYDPAKHGLKATKKYADERQKAPHNRKRKPSKAMANLYHL